MTSAEINGWFDQHEKSFGKSAWMDELRAVALKGLLQPEARLIEIVRKARTEGWYEDNPGWAEVDAILGLTPPPQRESP